MARLSRVVGRIFGSGAGVDQIAKFGSLFAGSTAYTTDPAEAQSLSNWLTGWFGAAIGGNAPAIEDMNASFFVLSYQIAQILQAGVPEWNTDTTYYTGQFVSDGAGVLYTSLVDTNLGNALTDTSKWRRYSSVGAVQSKSGTYTITPNDALIKANAGSAGFTLTLPSVAACTPGQPLRIKKTDSTSNVVTLAISGGDDIDGSSSITLTVPKEGATLVPDGATSWLIF